MKRKIEIFSANCPVCAEAVSQVKDLACPDCDIIVLDTHDSATAKRAKHLGIRSLPAVVIDGKLAECCTRGINADTLRQAGVGQAR